MKMAAIGDFLTESEIKKVLKLYKENKNQDFEFVQKVEKEIISPNINRINQSLGQENHPRYLAYVILYAMMKAK